MLLKGKFVINKKKIGLALGGGAAKGFAHVGIIKALENAGINIDYIAGTSMGALVGGYYAMTKNAKMLEDQILNTKRSDIFPISELIKRRDGALFRGESIADTLKKEFGDAKIENCKIPFTAVATDVANGDEVIINSGSLVEAIKASIALPAIFKPVEIGGKLLMDGGLANPVPADIVKNMGAEYVIAVDVSSKWMTAPDELLKTHDIYSIVSNAFSIIEYQIAKGPLKSADIVLRPPVLNYDWMNFEKARELIKIGERELELSLREIRRKTGYKKPPQTLGEKFLDFIFKPPHSCL